MNLDLKKVGVARRRLRIMGLLILLVWVRGGRAQTFVFPNLDLRQNILQVAEHHVRRGAWAEAILQYYSFLYHFPQDSLVAEINFKIARIYEVNHQPDLALQHLQQFVGALSPHATHYLEARLRLAYQFYKMGRYVDCIKYAWEQPEPPFKIVALYALVGLEAFLDVDSLLEVWASDLPDELAVMRELRQIKPGSYALPWTQKWGALIMSAVLPGSGRIYLQDYSNGLLTLGGFSGLVGLTYWSITQARQYLLFAGVLDLIYYGANLYATFREVERYRWHQVAQKYQRVVDRYPLEQVLGLSEIILGK